MRIVNAFGLKMPIVGLFHSKYRDSSSREGIPIRVCNVLWRLDTFHCNDKPELVENALAQEFVVAGNQIGIEYL
jgi:hypothetical protein